MGKNKDMSSSFNKISKIRKTLSCLLAIAVKKMFPSVKLGTGGITKDGFYYDFMFDRFFSADDLLDIEKEMKELVRKKINIDIKVFSIEEAKRIFSEMDEVLKLELLEDLVFSGRNSVGICISGNFYDLCPDLYEEDLMKNINEVPIEGFLLDHVSGVYWKGDEKREMLSRIYGLAFLSRNELEEYLHQRQEAEKKDHRKLGAELGLFIISPEVGKGLPLLTHKGATLRRILERFIVDEEIRRGYLHVYTPILGRKQLYERSGHWEHYRDSMYPPIKIDEEEYILRPMTCPHHIILYKSQPRSYRDLPIRYAEISPMYRKEKSGELYGLIRVMGFHLADAHIFIKPDQLKEVFAEVVDLIVYVMKTLGLGESCWYRLSLRDDKKQKYIDKPESWSIAEKAMREICREMGLDFEEAPGHAAFYGPKLDVQMRTASGHDETLFTNQIDLALAERFDLKYVDRDGSYKRPWIIHRSSIGCLERTMAFLIEHYAGAFPTWLAPVQVIVLPVTDKQLDYARIVTKQLRDYGIRTDLDERSETLNRKVRDAKKQKIPYICVVGEKERQSNSVTITNRDTGRKETMSLEVFIDQILKEDRERSLKLKIGG